MSLIICFSKFHLYSKDAWLYIEGAQFFKPIPQLNCKHSNVKILSFQILKRRKPISTSQFLFVSPSHTHKSRHFTRSLLFSRSCLPLHCTTVVFCRLNDAQDEIVKLRAKSGLVDDYERQNRSLRDELSLASTKKSYLDR